MNTVKREAEKGGENVGGVTISISTNTKCNKPDGELFGTGHVSCFKQDDLSSDSLDQEIWEKDLSWLKRNIR